jgi:hypothetical protein
VYSLNPSEITNNNLWLRSDLGVTEISGKVSQWDDQSSEGSNFTQATSTRRPTKVLSVYNSLPAIYYNPTFASESYALSYNDTAGKYKITDTNSGTIMLIMMSNGTNYDFNSGYYCPLARTNTNYGNQYALIRGVNTGPGSYQFGYPYPLADYFVVPTALNVPIQIIISHTNTASTIYVNGTNLGTITKNFTVFASDANSYLNLGCYYQPAANYASGRYTGYIFEVAFWQKALNTTEVNGLAKYFKDRYGVS